MDKNVSQAVFNSFLLKTIHFLHLGTSSAGPGAPGLQGGRGVPLGLSQELCARAWPPFFPLRKAEQPWSGVRLLWPLTECRRWSAAGLAQVRWRVRLGPTQQELLGTRWEGQLGGTSHWRAGKGGLEREPQAESPGWWVGGWGADHTRGKLS